MRGWVRDKAHDFPSDADAAVIMTSTGSWWWGGVGGDWWFLTRRWVTCFERRWGLLCCM